eukprot:4393973-Amphidinium_carterae.1
MAGTSLSQLGSHGTGSVTSQLTADPRQAAGQTLDVLKVLTFNALSMANKEAEKSLDPLRQTGQLKFLCDRLHAEKVDIAFIQESRLCLPQSFDIKSHHIIQNPSKHGIGGLLTLVAKSKHVVIKNHRQFGHRVLCVSLMYHGHTIFTVNSHAPIRKSAPEVHSEFATCMKRCLSTKAAGAILIGGSDLNTRVAEVPPDVHISGPLSSACPHKAVHAYELLRTLQAHGVFLANTFVNTSTESDGNLDSRAGRLRDDLPLSSSQHNAISTWCHPQTKLLFQIDFVLSCERALAALSTCSTLPWSYLDLMTCSDHRPVCASFLIGKTASKRRAPQPTRRHKCPAHLSAFQEHIRQKMNSFVPAAGASPLDTTAQLQSIAVESMQITRPKTTQPRQDWISPASWGHMKSLHTLRKFIKARKHSSDEGRWHLPLQLCAINGVPHPVELPCVLTATNSHAYPDEVLQGYAKAYTKLVRHLLRKDKRLWLDTKCAESQQFFNHHDAKKAYEIVKQLSKVQRRQRSGAALMTEDGTITHDKDDVSRRWAAYWQDHFAAELRTGLSFADRSLPILEFRGVASEFHTSVAEVKGLLRTMNKNSVAPDLCPHRYWVHLEPHWSTALMESFNLCLDQGTIPPAWSGSLVVPIPKPNKAQTLLSSHRPIQLMLMEAKVFSRLLLRHLSSYIAISWLQMARCGVLPPLATSQQFVAHTRDSAMSAAMIFVDISAAYDDVSHMLMFGNPGERNKDDIVYLGLQRLGLNHDESSATQDYLRQYPHHILCDRVPPRLLKVLKSWVTSPWFQLPERHSYAPDEAEEHQVLKTTKGIRQGDCLSTFLFCAFFDVALLELHEHLYANTNEIEFHKGRSPEDIPCMSAPGCDSGAERRLTLVAYADDLMVPVAHRDPCILLRQLQKFLDCMSETFQRFKLRLNYGPQKTELCLRLTTRAAKPIMQHLKEQAVRCAAVDDLKMNPQPAVPFSTGAIKIVNSYRHLGRWSGMTISPHHDMSVQRARTIEAFHQHQKVLTSGRYSVATRLYLFKTLVRCLLAQNATSYCSWPTRSVAALNGTYLLLLRRVVFLGHQDEFFLATEDAFLAYIGEPTLRQLFDMKIAAFIPRVCASANPQIQAALQCTSKSSLWTSWLAVLERVHVNLPSLATMPVPSIWCFQNWLAMMTIAGKQWKSMVQESFGLARPTAQLSKIYTIHAASIPRHLAEHEVEGFLDMEQPDPEETLQCPYCDQQCKGGRGLLAHKLKTHRIVPPLALRTRGTVCLSCGSQMGTRARLLDHLRRKLSCALWTTHHVEPMSSEDYYATVADLNTVDELGTRDLPRTGPIPLIDGRFQSQCVQSINPFESD